MPLVHNASSSSARLCVCWLRTLAAFGRRDRVGGAAAATAVRRAARAAWRSPPAGSSSSPASCGRAPAPLRLRWRWPAQCVPAARGYFPAPLRPSCRGRSTWRRSTGRGRSACAASWKTCSCGRVRRGRCRRRRLTMVSERSLGVGIGALVHLMGCRAAQSGSRARARSRRKVECMPSVSRHADVLPLRSAAWSLWHGWRPGAGAGPNQKSQSMPHVGVTLLSVPLTCVLGIPCPFCRVAGCPLACRSRSDSSPGRVPRAGWRARARAGRPSPHVVPLAGLEERHVRGGRLLRRQRGHPGLPV